MILIKEVRDHAGIVLSYFCNVRQAGYSLDKRHLISNAGLGDDVIGLFGVVLQLLPETRQCHP